jgi:hypothetical protein
MPKNIFKGLKKLGFLNLDGNSCVSGQIFDVEKKSQFTEDLLTRCTCKLLKEDKTDGKLKKILMFSCAIVGVAAIFLICRAMIKTAGNCFPTNTRFNILRDGK